MQVSAQPAYRQVDFRSESPDRSEEDDQHVILENSTDSLESDSEQDWLTLCEDPDAHIRPPTEEEPNPPTLYEVMLTVVDWYAYHKQTYTATTDLYNITLALRLQHIMCKWLHIMCTQPTAHNVQQSDSSAHSTLFCTLCVVVARPQGNVQLGCTLTLCSVVAHYVLQCCGAHNIAHKCAANI